MINRIADILGHSHFYFYLYGSVTCNDFRPGWSDIDFICLTGGPITPEAAKALVMLRQTLAEQYPDNNYFRLFEGAIATGYNFVTTKNGTAVYWGTSGQRIVDSYTLCTFSTISLLEYGICMHGADIRHLLAHPTRQDIIDAIIAHYNTIRAHGKCGGGWMLDIARCLYTLRTNKIITKTKAGEWAIDQGLCPNKEVMDTVLSIRKNPESLKNSMELQKFSDSLMEHIQEFANVLQEELTPI